MGAELKFGYRPAVRDLAQLSISRTDSRLTAQGYEEVPVSSTENNAVRPPAAPSRPDQAGKVSSRFRTSAAARLSATPRPGMPGRLRLPRLWQGCPPLEPRSSRPPSGQRGKGLPVHLRHMLQWQYPGREFWPLGNWLLQSVSDS